MNSYQKSRELMARYRKVVPSGCQTYSKSYIQYPQGHSPLFLERGQGGLVEDVDGNWFVDLVGGLLPVILGYSDPDVNAAISAQLEKGVSFSLATELEIELAERLVRLIPCAEMVRFGKNGTDVTSAAIRVARAYTKRERVISCGYHGWQDWYVGATTRNKGVPLAVQNLTHRVNYNDLNSIETLFRTYPGEVALVILEPMNADEPKDNFLTELRALCHRHGALLVFDEIITGFRYDLGGAQKLFGVVPDLACFGKAMGNGMPISALVGKAEYMEEMDEIFFSGTFNGEALSIAAAIATIDKLEATNAIPRIWDYGTKLKKATEEVISLTGLEGVISLHGKAPWILQRFEDHPNATKEVISTAFMKEMISRGVLINGSHNVCFAHTERDMQLIIDAYTESCEFLSRQLSQATLFETLDCPVIKPVFKPRKI